jgi:hypothetical protein
VVARLAPDGPDLVPVLLDGRAVTVLTRAQLTGTAPGPLACDPPTAALATDSALAHQH